MLCSDKGSLFYELGLSLDPGQRRWCKCTWCLHAVPGPLIINKILTLMSFQLVHPNYHVKFIPLPTSH
jgi:hypothetical protein